MQNKEQVSSILSALNPALIAEVKRLELRSKRTVTSDMMGRYRSAFRGSGLTFSDLRAYEPGDDVKHIHWKVTARTGKAFVKTYDEERQLRILLMVDCSASTGVGGEKTNYSRAVEFASFLSLLALRSRDRLGLCLFSDRIEEYLPPKASRHQCTRVLLSLLSSRELRPATNIASALEHISSHERRPCIIFLISDFVSPNYEEQLKRAALRHDIIGVTTSGLQLSPTQNLGLVTFRDAESGAECVVDLSTKQARLAYAQQLEAQQSKLQNSLRRCGADFIHISDNPIRPLSELMKRRMSRMR